VDSARLAIVLSLIMMPVLAGVSIISVVLQQFKKRPSMAIMPLTEVDYTAKAIRIMIEAC